MTPAERASSGAGLGPAVQDLADRQFGVVHRTQLLELGMSGSAVSTWTRSGRLQRLHPSVYVVGHRRILPDGWRTAALLTTGSDACLSHWAGLAVRGLAKDRSVVHVIAPGRRGATVPGVKVHRTALHPDERDEHDGFPVTTVERAIIDIAAEASELRLGAVLDDALRRSLYDHRRMALAIDRAHGRRGIGKVKAAVRLLSGEGELLRSITERAVRNQLVNAGIRRPLVNVPISIGNGRYFELDLCWPLLRLNVEIDGPHHLLPHQMRADGLRDRWLGRRGFRVQRFPVERVDREFAAVTEEIRDLVETCSRTRPLSGHHLEFG